MMVLIAQNENHFREHKKQLKTELHKHIYKQIMCPNTDVMEYVYNVKYITVA